MPDETENRRLNAHACAAVNGDAEDREAAGKELLDDGESASSSDSYEEEAQNATGQKKRKAHLSSSSSASAQSKHKISGNDREVSVADLSRNLCERGVAAIGQVVLKTRYGKKSTEQVVVHDVSDRQWAQLCDATNRTGGNATSANEIKCDRPQCVLPNFPEGRDVKAKWQGQMWVQQGQSYPTNMTIPVKLENISLRYEQRKIKMKISVSRMGRN
eukprot:CAMPEP_0194305060 /NCGR_PEP_ID=MMETSP0171-20130528/2587_1 /TAXON_ID=218684 /ORGANISM="Corethron pennatum, Strain L29A3" /LENGTH=215 /DNA_ID=CAMNT_0039056475 /DNA_START=75 /DNA_END=722 /DNA_ORIENTATION=+